MARQENTKELFLFEALKLFGERGYDAVKISEIAKNVGCTAPALYRHYENKQQLYNAILKDSIEGYNESMRRLKLDLKEHPEEKERVISITEEQQINLAKDLFLHPLHDEWASAFRKLMMIEQFHRKELAEMYDKRYVYTQYEQHAEFFKVLMEAGRIKQGDPYTMAVMYVSPIVVLVGVCDREPEREEWALDLIEKHVREFNRNYRLS